MLIHVNILFGNFAICSCIVIYVAYCFVKYSDGKGQISVKWHIFSIAVISLLSLFAYKYMFVMIYAR